MSELISKREELLTKLKLYAESEYVGNQAFLGLKGVGKTSLILSYFNAEKKKELAKTHKKLFVYTKIDSRKKGDDLYQFLLNQVKVGVMMIPEPEVVNEIRQEMVNIDVFFDTADARLDMYLNLIKEKDYKLILIMDHFHCMSRDSEIALEQYEVLRSFNEQKLIRYWIITDTDLMETCATEQYAASFFAQKFTSKCTIVPMTAEETMNVACNYAKLKRCDCTEQEFECICNLSGGVPQLVTIMLDALAGYKKEQDFDCESFGTYMLSNEGCESLMQSWMAGLASAQSEILYKVAMVADGVFDEEVMEVDGSKMAGLSDDVGRGLLHLEKNDNNRSWMISVPLLKLYIQKKGIDALCLPEARKSELRANVQAGNITNIYVNGDYIQSQTNNIINVAGAVSGLEELYRLIKNHNNFVEPLELKDKLECLPFQKDEWRELDEERQEEELEKYADEIFSSDIFVNETLSQEQMERFHLTSELLDRLTPGCRNQITCGIIIYDLLQVCVDRYGLNIQESESSRGILFARAFERHIKDCAYNTFCKIDEFAKQKVKLGNKEISLAQCAIDKTTIGTYVCMMEYKKSYLELADISMNVLGYSDKDEVWWSELTAKIKQICTLRNECCHSGTAFDYEKLIKLKDLIFSQNALEHILLMKELVK